MNVGVITNHMGVYKFRKSRKKFKLVKSNLGFEYSITHLLKTILVRRLIVDQRCFR